MTFVLTRRGRSDLARKITLYLVLVLLAVAVGLLSWTITSWISTEGGFEPITVAIQAVLPILLFLVQFFALSQFMDQRDAKTRQRLRLMWMNSAAVMVGIAGGIGANAIYRTQFQEPVRSFVFLIDMSDYMIDELDNDIAKANMVSLTVAQIMNSNELVGAPIVIRSLGGGNSGDCNRSEREIDTLYTSERQRRDINQRAEDLARRAGGNTAYVPGFNLFLEEDIPYLQATYNSTEYMLIVFLGAESRASNDECATIDYLNLEDQIDKLEDEGINNLYLCTLTFFSDDVSSEDIAGDIAAFVREGQRQDCRENIAQIEDIEPATNAVYKNIGNFMTGAPITSSLVLCPGTMPSRLNVGDTGYVSYNLGLNFRTNPGNQSGEISRLFLGEAFTIIDGYECFNGLTWWQIELNDGTSGWVAEATEDYYLLAPDRVSAAYLPRELIRSCEEASTVELRSGQMVQVSIDSAMLFRDQGRLQVVDELFVGSNVIVLGGPSCGTTTRMWYVRVAGGRLDQIEGWISESAIGEQITACPDVSPLRLAVGQTGRVLGPVNSRIRSEPTTDATSVGEAEPGEIFNVIGGPICADGYTWWQIEVRATGLIGWTVEGAGADGWNFEGAGDYWLEPLANPSTN